MSNEEQAKALAADLHGIRLQITTWRTELSFALDDQIGPRDEQRIATIRSKIHELELERDKIALLLPVPSVQGLPAVQGSYQAHSQPNASGGNADTGKGDTSTTSSPYVGSRIVAKAHDA